MKIEVGKQYKARDGHRAVVLEKAEDGLLLVWRRGGSSLFFHDEDGVCGGLRERDLISEWTEPKTGTVWVNIYEGTLRGSAWDTVQGAKDAAKGGVIARVRVDWTEGVFDE